MLMSRTDYYDDPNAPRANSLIPGASAVVVDDQGRILLHQRSDNGFWALPGGAMDIDEYIVQTAIREVKEETGLDVAVDRLIGIYSNPHHVVEFSDGEIRQQFSVCFACRILSGELSVSKESFRVGFFAPDDVERLDMHESIRLRIRHYLERRPQPFIG